MHMSMYNGLGIIYTLYAIQVDGMDKPQVTDGCSHLRVDQ